MTRIYDIPQASGAVVDVGTVPGAVITLHSIGPSIDSSWPGNGGISYTFGATDLIDMIHLNNSSGYSGAHWFDGGQNCLAGPWQQPPHGSINGYQFYFGNLDCGQGAVQPSCYDLFMRNDDTSNVLAALLIGNRCQSKVGMFTLNAAPGLQSVTGIGFEPDFILFFGPNQYPPAHDSNPCFSGAGTAHCIGAVDKDGNQWSCAARSDFFSGSAFLGGYTNTVGRRTRWRTDACFQHLAAQAYVYGPTADQTGAFVSMDSDGFTVDLLDAARTSGTMICAYLAIKLDDGAGQIKVGHGTQGDSTITTGFAPEAILMASAQNADELLNLFHCNASVGMVSGTGGSKKQRSFWAGSDSGGPSAPDPHGAWYTDRTLHMQDLSGIAHADVDLSGTGADLTWTQTDAVGRKFGWVAFSVSETSPERPSIVVSTPAASCGHATLSGAFTANAPPGTHGFHAYFFWGPYPGPYLHAVDLGTLPVSPDPVTLTAVISGLTNGATYHYTGQLTDRVGGDDLFPENCTTLGDDVVFTVGPCGVSVHHTYGVT